MEYKFANNNNNLLISKKILDYKVKYLKYKHQYQSVVVTGGLRSS